GSATPQASRRAGEQDTGGAPGAAPAAAVGLRRRVHPRPGLEPRCAGPDHGAGQLHLRPVDLGLGRGARHGGRRLGTDPLRVRPIPAAPPRRGAGPDPLQPPARGLLHDGADPHGRRVLLPDGPGPGRRHRGPTRSRRHRRGRRLPVVVGLQPRSRRARPRGRPGERGVRLRRVRLRHGRRRRDPDPRPAGRPDRPVQPLLARRHPQLRRPVLPDADGRHPGPHQPVPGDDHRRGDVRRQVLRALRPAPRPDAVHPRGRQPAGVRGLPGRAAGDRPDLRDPAAGRRQRHHADRAGREPEPGRKPGV
ncbi:MAG: Cytochrome c oxidase polypeptide II, partial [uncultured Nocardioides sp.]